MAFASERLIDKLQTIIFVELCIIAAFWFNSVFPDSTPLQAFILRVVLSLLAAAGVGAAIFGIVTVGYSVLSRAAMSASYMAAIFSLVYLLIPAILWGRLGLSLPEANHQVLPTPAGPGERLIMVAGFQDRGEGRLSSRIDPTGIIVDQISQNAQGAAVRVARYPDIITTPGAAQRIGDQYQSSLVIWGWFDDSGIQPFIQFGPRLTLDASSDIATPTQLTFSPVEEADTRAAYIAQLSLGLAHVNLESSDDLQQALDHFNTAVAIYDDWEALMWRANCYTWLGGHQFALRDFERAVAVKPENAAGYNNRGVVYVRLGNDQAAIDDYTQALLINPEYDRAYFNRAQARGRQGNLEGAIEDYTRAIDLNPGNALAYVGRGNIRGMMQDFQAAINDYGQALALKPDGLVYVHRGNAYAALRNYQAAVDDYTQALSLNPADTLAYVNRGNAYAAMLDYQAAIDSYTQALALNPKDNLAYMHRGNTYVALRNYQAAIDDYTRALVVNPSDAWAYVNRGNAYAAAQDYRAALEDYTQALVHDPDNGLAFMHRGNTYSALQDYQAAIEDYTQALTFDPADPLALVSRGHTYAAALDYEAAINDYTQAIAVSPTDASVYVSRGNAYGALLDYESAINDYTRAIDINPEYALAYSNRGAAYKEQWYLGQPTREQAIADFERVLALISDPDWRQMVENDLQELNVTNRRFVGE